MRYAIIILLCATSLPALAANDPYPPPPPPPPEKMKDQLQRFEQILSHLEGFDAKSAEQRQAVIRQVTEVAPRDSCGFEILSPLKRGDTETAARNAIVAHRGSTIGLLKAEMKRLLAKHGRAAVANIRVLHKAVKRNQAEINNATRLGRELIGKATKLPVSQKPSHNDVHQRIERALTDHGLQRTVGWLAREAPEATVVAPGTGQASKANKTIEYNDNRMTLRFWVTDPNGARRNHSTSTITDNSDHLVIESTNDHHWTRSTARKLTKKSSIVRVRYQRFGENRQRGSYAITRVGGQEKQLLKPYGAALYKAARFKARLTKSATSPRYQ